MIGERRDRLVPPDERREYEGFTSALQREVNDLVRLSDKVRAGRESSVDIARANSSSSTSSVPSIC